MVSSIRALNASDIDVQLIQQLSNTGIWRINCADNIVSASDYFFTLHGLSPSQDGVDLTWIVNNFTHPDDQAGLTTALQDAALHLRPINIEYRITLPSGDERTVLLEGSPYQGESDSAKYYSGIIRDITLQKQHEYDLIRSEERWRTLTMNTPDIIMHVDLSGRILFINYPLPEHDPNEVVKFTLYDFLPPDQQGDIQRCLTQVKETGQPDKFNVAFPDPDGNERFFEGYVSALKENEQVVSLIVAARDVTDRVATQKQMEKLSCALENTADSVLIANQDAVIEYINKSFEIVSGKSAKELVGKSLYVLNDEENSDFFDLFDLNIDKGEVFSQLFVHRPTESQIFFEQKTVTPVKDEHDQFIHFVITGKDVTEYMKVQDRLQHLAHHDILTALPNRSLFMDRLKQAITRARRNTTQVATIFIDLDRFKNINDTLGHDIGDRFLKKVAERLRSCVRERDTVARLGGDEFAIVLEDVTSAKNISDLARKIINTLQPAITVESHSLYVTASIGISLFPQDAKDANSLLKSADMAMYRAKDLGKNNFQFYSKDMGERVLERLSLENNLREALRKNQFELYYQPIYDVSKNTIVSVEALLRWRHPDMGLIAPLDFIRILEETGLIIGIGDWTIQQSAKQLKAWQNLGYKNLSISVNVSSRQFNESSLVKTIAQTIEEQQLPLGSIELEITESLFMEKHPVVQENINTLNALGVRLALDDFGTGFSSLSYLHRFPINTLKIDRSFIHDSFSTGKNKELLKAIIAMGNIMKLKVISEGVETEEQKQFLLSNDSHLQQGYLFCEPIKADDLTERLKKQKTLFSFGPFSSLDI